MKLKPNLNDKVTVVIPENNQEINGVINELSQSGGGSGLKLFSCSIELDELIKIYPVTEVLIDFGDNIRRNAIVLSYSELSLSLTGVNLNK